MRNTAHSCIIIISFQKVLIQRKFFMKNFLNMCAMHVYVHLAHIITLDYVPSVVML
jgi:hypothetical protein